MCFYKFKYFLRCRACILPQRPADGIVDEKPNAISMLPTWVEEQFLMGIGTLARLVEYRCPHQPHIPAVPQTLYPVVAHLGMDGKVLTHHMHRKRLYHIPLRVSGIGFFGVIHQVVFPPFSGFRQIFLYCAVPFHTGSFPRRHRKCTRFCTLQRHFAKAGRCEAYMLWFFDAVNGNGWRIQASIPCASVILGYARKSDSKWHIYTRKALQWGQSYLLICRKDRLHSQTLARLPAPHRGRCRGAVPPTPSRLPRGERARKRAAQKP